MKKIFHLFFVITLLINSTFVFSEELKNENVQNLSEEAEPKEKTYSITELLCGYLENDLELQKLTIAVEKSDLSLQQTKIDNGFDISLSTGNVTFYTGSERSSINVKPTVKLSVPKAKNLSVSAQTDFRYVISGFGSDEQYNGLGDSKFAVGFDILSEADAAAKIKILQSERSLLEAKRSLESSALAAEKQFYTSLENLLSEINSIFTYLQDVYKDTLDFEKIKAQGYTQSSSTYRLAEMKVLSGRHNVDSAFHVLIHDFAVFYKKCGVELDFGEKIDFLKYIPSDIPDVEMLDIRDFDKEMFSEIEKATWTHEINSIVRKAERFVTLGVNTGYTINNRTTKSDTVDAGVSSTIGGVGLNFGISMPIGLKDFTPAFSMSATLNPNKFRTHKITKQQNALTEKQELLDIETARTNYDTTVVDLKKQMENLIWEKNSVDTNFDLYEKNEADLQKYYKMGIVSESEYLSAKNNRQLYQVKKIINKLDAILFNNSVQSKFVSLNKNEKSGEVK